MNRTLTSGKVTLFVSDTRALNLKAENKKIALDVIDRKVMKKILKASAGTEKTSLRGILGKLEKIAEQLKRGGLTLTLAYKGDVVLTLGATSKPKISQLVTKTKAIEINNLSKLIQMVV